MAVTSREAGTQTPSDDQASSHLPLTVSTTSHSYLSEQPSAHTLTPPVLETLSLAKADIVCLQRDRDSVKEELAKEVKKHDEFKKESEVSVSLLMCLCPNSYDRHLTVSSIGMWGVEGCSLRVLSLGTRQTGEDGGEHGHLPCHLLSPWIPIAGLLLTTWMSTHASHQLLAVMVTLAGTIRFARSSKQTAPDGAEDVTTRPS